jgi:hypothetical protein
MTGPLRSKYRVPITKFGEGVQAWAKACINQAIRRMKSAKSVDLELVPYDSYISGLGEDGTHIHTSRACPHEQT